MELLRGTHTFADHFTVPSGKILKTENNTQMNFASGKYLYVYGTLNAYNSTYTASSSSWGGIKYYSGSSGTIQYADISNAYVGIYANNSSPSVKYTDIVNNLITSGASRRVAGVQVYDTDEPNLYNNTIKGSFTYGLAQTQIFQS